MSVKGISPLGVNILLCNHYNNWFSETEVDLYPFTYAYVRLVV